MRKTLILAILALLSPKAIADTTIFQSIGPINFNGDTNTSYFRGDLKWGASGCPNATYVQVKSDVSGRKEIFSIGLAAKMAGKRVQFWGVCDADLDYFNASYVVVE